jgi:hypothetical protein
MPLDSGKSGWIVDQVYSLNIMRVLIKYRNEVSRIKSYAGIGSRSTPNEILELFVKIGKFLAERGYVLRSGGANGSDQSFETGCNRGSGLKEIYLPWSGFEGSSSTLIVKDQKAYEIAKAHHPYWDNLSQGARKLQARNSHQVLGKDLESPCNFIICWTKKGKGEGGTGQALRIAESNDVPIFDAGRHGDLEEVRLNLKEFFVELEVM